MSIDQGDGPKPGSSELTSINKKGEQDPFITNFWNQFLEKASTIPSGFDVVTWPIRMIDELEFAIAASRASKLYPNSPPPRTNVVGEKLEPWKDGIKRIKTAFLIVGYNYVKNQPKGVFPWHEASSLEAQIEDEQFYGVDYVKGVDSVRLSDPEADVLQRLCRTPKYTIDAEGLKTIRPTIPVDPQKRVYRLSEALSPMPQKV